MGKNLELMGEKKCGRGPGTITRRKSMVDITRLAILTFLVFLSIVVNSAVAADTPRPILFVHGSGDSAALGIQPSGALSQTAMIPHFSLQSTSLIRGREATTQSLRRIEAVRLIN